LIGPIVLISLLAGCASRPPASQASPPPAESTGPVAAAPAPQSLTDGEIQSIIRASGLSLVGLRRESIACATPARPGNGGQNGFPPGNPLQTESPYGAWLGYVANHVKTNTPFGGDYPAVAAGALDVSGSSDPTGEACLNFRNIRVDLQRAIAAADPAKVRQQLFNSFSAYDQSTRERAAQLLQ
jgi:hypothetical protein